MEREEKKKDLKEYENFQTVWSVVCTPGTNSIFWNVLIVPDISTKEKIWEKIVLILNVFANKILLFYIYFYN